MSFEITTAFVKQFGNTVDILSQQDGSRLLNSVRMESTVRGEEVFLDQIGSTSAVRVTTRHADSPLVHTPHDRRRITMVDVEWGDLVDDFDRLKMIIDPSSPMSQNAGMAIGREIDEIIIENIFSDAATGKEGGTVTPFDSNNVVAVNFGAGSNTGLTVEKLREARRILRANETNPNEERFIGVTAEQLDDLLGTTEVTSADFNTVKALTNGEVDTFMGFRFVHTELFETDGSGFRRCPFWTRSGIGLAVAQNPTVRITERPDKRFSQYLYYSTSVGAARVEEAKVGEIKCNEA
jgi:hypothetical protein